MRAWLTIPALWLPLAASALTAQAHGGASPASTQLSGGQAADSELTALLARIAANAAQYHATLPSIQADEAIDSVHYVSLYKRHEVATATMRVADDDTHKRRESRTILTVNGKPLPEGNQHTLPTTLYGAFGGAEEAYFSAGRQACYSFTLGPGTDIAREVIFTERAASWDTVAGCSFNRYEVRGLVRLDAATAQITHLERRIPPDQASARHLAEFVSVDLAPADVGGKSFWLPTRIVGELEHGRSRFTATYSNFRRFAGSMKILPGTEEPAAAAHETAQEPAPR